MRKPLQGVVNIIRFNWHYYVLSISLVTAILFIQYYLDSFSTIAFILMLLIIFPIVVSLFISAYIYDFSDLYKFGWLHNLKQSEKETIININAGFDETTTLLKGLLPNSEILSADFYDPSKHTEISIKRARKTYPPFPHTKQVCSGNLPVPDNSVEKVFAILSAHEIREDEERIAFFKELKRVLKPSGEIVVTEHLRDTANFFAYNIGFFHFHSKATWINTFDAAGLRVSKQLKTTPFITTFVLEKYGTAY